MTKVRKTPADFVRLMAASKTLAESGDRQTAMELVDKATALFLSRKIKLSDWRGLDPLEELLRARAWLRPNETVSGSVQVTDQDPD